VASQIFPVIVAPVAADALRALPRNIQVGLGRKIRSLREFPLLKGKRLRDELEGFRSIKLGRYRALFRVDEAIPVVHVPILGIRKVGDKNDVYALVLCHS